MRHLAFLLALPVFADITDAQRAEYWKTQAELNQVLLQLTQARAKAEEVLAKLKTSCGDKPIVADANGHPACKEPDAKHDQAKQPTDKR